MNPQPDAVADNVALLRQGVALVARLGAQSFTGVSEHCPGGSVGAHVRHCLDFYVAFLDGVTEGRIDYDARERDAELETVPARALRVLEEIAARLHALRAADRDAPLLVRGDGSAHDEGVWTRSSIGRELQFLVSHTIHHFALIGFLLRANGHAVDGLFGVAPSTARHWESTGARAS
jgi:uncharacterized damage-inducible protein DinB